MPRSHLYVKARPVRATEDHFREIEWDVAISWQLRGLRGSYVVYVSLLGAKIALRGSYWTNLREGVTV